MAYLGVILLLFSEMAFALEFASNLNKSNVIELYTSEGCSSCPPADKWLSNWKNSPRLFKDIIPMAFHVDYWDGLGWKDPWATSAFSYRQRQLAQQGLLSQVYTPAILLTSQEWRTWRMHKQLPNIKPVKAGVLSATINENELMVMYSVEGDYELNIAYLGMGLVSNITAGENRSRELHHDFVVLEHFKQKGELMWNVVLPAIPKQGQTQTAISVWLTKVNSLEIEQAAAAFVN